MSDIKMPALFLGHGSPMNAVDDTAYSQLWQSLGENLPMPKAIIVVSAHWYTNGTFATAMAKPKTIHDFYGFPQRLFDMRYPAPGQPALAEQIQQLVGADKLTLDENKWGLDHGCWAILSSMYPCADIPVVQISVDASQHASYHYELGQQISQLRRQGVLIIGSGAIVHNLRTLNYSMPESGYSWAEDFNDFVEQNINYIGSQHPLFDFMQHPAGKTSCPTPEHFLPILPILGVWDQQEPIEVILNGVELGSLSKLSFQIG